MKIVANNKIKCNFHRRGREVIRANSKELAFLFELNFHVQMIVLVELFSFVKIELGHY